MLFKKFKQLQSAKYYSINIQPDQVHKILAQTMLVDGYKLVCDLNKSEGPYLHDSVTDKKYLDFATSFASQPLSYNHPKLNNEIFKKHIGNIAIHNPANSDIYTQEMANFVATFQQHCMPTNFEHLFLVQGGTLAVENAIKTAIDWKTQLNNSKARDIIHFKEAFHGRSGYSLSLTNTDPIKYKYFPLFQWPRCNNPKIKFPLNENNLEATIKAETETLNYMEKILHNNETIAAIILEPIQGEGGDNHFRPEFWQALRKLADKYKILLIADEVQSGMGITGKMWAYEHLGAQPDIICFGKKAQVCGIMCNKRIDNVPNVFRVPSRISSTWGGNLTDMVRSQKMIEIVHEDNLVDNAKIVGEYLLNKLHKLQLLHPNKMSAVRGRGLMCAFDLHNGEKCKKFVELAYDNQVLTLPCGTNSIRLRPFLDINKEHIDKLISIIDYCLIKL